MKLFGTSGDIKSTREIESKWKIKDMKTFSIVALALADSLLKITEEVSTSKFPLKDSNRLGKLRLGILKSIVSNRSLFCKQLCDLKPQKRETRHQDVLTLSLVSQLRAAGSETRKKVQVTTPFVRVPFPPSLDTVVMTLESRGDDVHDWAYVASRLLHEGTKRIPTESIELRRCAQFSS